MLVVDVDTHKSEWIYIHHQVIKNSFISQILYICIGVRSINIIIKIGEVGWNHLWSHE